MEKRDSTLNFVYIALSLQRLHGFKVFTRGYKGYNELQGVTGGYKGLQGIIPKLINYGEDQHVLVIDNGKIKIVCVF